MAREAYTTARKLGLRALELRPTLGARYVAARAAWRLQDWAAVQLEMEKVREQARDHEEPTIEALALTALAEASLKRDARPGSARRRSSTRRSSSSKGEEDPVARFDALAVRATVGAWQGDLDDTVRYMERAYGIALDAGRKDLQTIAAQALAQTHIIRLELDEAELLLTRALELAGESGSVRARVGATLAYGVVPRRSRASSTPPRRCSRRSGRPRPSSASSPRSRPRSRSSAGSPACAATTSGQRSCSARRCA